MAEFVITNLLSLLIAGGIAISNAVIGFLGLVLSDFQRRENKAEYFASFYRRKELELFLSNAKGDLSMYVIFLVLAHFGLALFVLFLSSNYFGKRREK